MTPPRLMSAQSPASDISPRAHSASIATPHTIQHHEPPTPSEAHILASLRRDSGIMEFVQPQYAPNPVPRSVKFELVEDSHQYRARIPMRVQIYPHDTTESIISTVKNFYGLYPTATSCPGVSFEDEHGNTIIGRYENFRHNSVVYVRVRDGPPTPGPHAALPNGSGTQVYYTQDGYVVQHPQPQGLHLSRPGSRSSRRRSVSPGSVNGRRSASTSTSSKNTRPRSSKSRGTASQTNSDAMTDSMNGYSSGDGAPGSSSSGKPKELIGSTEISLDNIVEGGRRKRAKFESSELPLFAPPQMPAAISNPSVSPVRRTEHNRASLPFVQPGQNAFTNAAALQSPQTHNANYNSTAMYPTPMTAPRASRGAVNYTAGTAAGPSVGVLATPDPTVGSCMSEEDKDVAMQLMRLGDISGHSHGRTSASTLDDTFSRNADAASSTGATSDGESESEADEKLPMHKQKLDTHVESRSTYPSTEATFSSAHGDAEPSDEEEDGYSESALKGTMAAPKLKVPKAAANGVKPRSNGTKLKANKATKSIKTATGAKVRKAGSIPNGPMSPASLPASRKPSVVSNPGGASMLGEDDQPDLSTKPRCQRCRKSKKGCDRQRPCGRCRDAGIPAELCISEDEGNGRKGRYGRHMGVPIKKDELPEAGSALLPPATIAPTTAMFAASGPSDKSKKRKR